MCGPSKVDSRYLISHEFPVLRAKAMSRLKLQTKLVRLPLGMSLPVGSSTSGAWGMPEAAAVLTAIALADLAGFSGCHPTLFAR